MLVVGFADGQLAAVQSGPTFVSRLALSLLLLLVAVPAASASQAGGELPYCGAGPTSGVPVPDRSAGPRDLALSVRSAPATPFPGQKLRWILSLRNRTSNALHMRFRSSKYAEVVLRRDGEIVYSHTDNHAFLQVVIIWRLDARATYVCELGPDRLDLEPGRYELTADLASSTAPVGTRRSLLVRGRRPFAP